MAPWQVPIWTFMVEGRGARPLLAAARAETVKQAHDAVVAGVSRATGMVHGGFRVVQTGLAGPDGQAYGVVHVGLALEHARSVPPTDFKAVTIAEAS